MNNDNIYYSPNKVISYNSLLNYIIGERGVGKSYGFKKWVVKHFIKTNKQFVYMRRYKTELSKAMMKNNIPCFFSQIEKDEELKGIKMTNTSDTFKINDKVAGFAIPLSISNILKSSTYDNVDTIIFDEFILDKGNYHYLQDEVIKMLELIETISRLRNVRIFFLGNAISESNPYFAYFNLTLPYNTDIKIFKRDSKGNPLILVEYIKNEKYREVKNKSRFGQLINGTKYGDYAINNQMLRDTKTFIKKHDKNAKFVFNLILDDNKFGIWCDYKNDIIYVSNKYDSNYKINFALNSEEHNEKTMLIKARTSIWFQSLLNHYRLGQLHFESIKIKNIVLKYINKYLY